MFRGAEYQRVKKIKKKDPLTFHDMNLSAQEDQTKLNCDLESSPEFESESTNCYVMYFILTIVEKGLFYIYEYLL